MVNKELVQKAISLSSLLKKELTPLIPERAWDAERAHLSYSEKERLLRVRSRINDRLVEMLYKRAMQTGGALETEPIVVNTYPEKTDMYACNAFPEDMPSVFYVLEDTFYSSENDFFGQNSFEEDELLPLRIIADMYSYCGYDFESIEESDIDDYLDYAGESIFDDVDEVDFESIRSKVWETIIAFKTYKNFLGKKQKKLTSWQKELCKGIYDVIIDTLSKMCRHFSKSEISERIGDFISIEDVVMNFSQLVGNLYGEGYDRELFIYLNSDIPKVYLHQDDYKDTPEKTALICAIEYFMDLERKLPFFPGAQFFSFMKENSFVLCTGVGGFSGDEYLVGYEDFPNWWKLSKQLIDILLPVVLNQKK